MTALHEILITRAVRPDGTPHANAFRATLGGEGETICVSETPFFDTVRILLARGLAAHKDLLVMRHAGSDAIALKGRVGVAAWIARS